MIRINSIKLNIDYSEQDIKAQVLKKLRINSSDLLSIKIAKLSLDARKKDHIHYICAVDATVKDEKRLIGKHLPDVSMSKALCYKAPLLNKDIDFSNTKRPVIIGFGPAGMFCGLMLAKAGLKPIIYERGQDVDTRIAAVNKFWKTGELNTESNVQFGEGGAGTFSDGKLNTMVHDDFGRISYVFSTFVEHGAPESIKYINKPHIGTDRLTSIVKGIREEITALGGEVHFDSKVTDFILDKKRICGVIVNNNIRVESDVVVLAIGHSARDTFYLLRDYNFFLEKKAFAAGVRVQHPQELIGRAQYGEAYTKLPAADYKLTYQTEKGRSVYSFCMCPGGFVVNASSEDGRLVVNGMSNSDRNEPTANSAIVVNVTPEDFGGDDILSGVEFQRSLEALAYKIGGGRIPVQYYKDFKDSSISVLTDSFLPNTKGTYISANLRNVLPEFISEAIIEAFPKFGNTIQSFSDDSALFIGVETRTSSPIRITRDNNFESINYSGFFPCGEGAGYAGGITSAAVDGIKVSEAVINYYNMH